MYKIHSKLVFLKKINTSKKKSSRSASEQCKRITLFTIFNMNSASLCTVHVNFTVHWTVQLTWTVQKKQGIDALQILRFQRRKKVGPSEQYATFLFNQTVATAF
jgi:hypothetical protein